MTALPPQPPQRVTEAAARRSSLDFEAALARAQVRIESAAYRHSEWPDQVAAGLRAALELAADDPGTARLLSLELLSSGREGLGRLHRLVDHYAACLRRGRELYPQSASLPQITESTLVNGLVSWVAQRLYAGEASALPTEAGGLIRFILTPYLGVEHADAVSRRHGARAERGSETNGVAAEALRATSWSQARFGPGWPGR